MPEIRAFTPRGHVIFCDDIRLEVDGKRQYLGIYTALITLHAEPPVVLPKLCIAIDYFERPNESEESVEIQVFLPGAQIDLEPPLVNFKIEREQFLSIPVPTDPDAEDPQIGVSMNFTLSNVQLNAAGRIKVRAKRGDDIIRLGSLLVAFNSITLHS